MSRAATVERSSRLERASGDTRGPVLERYLRWRDYIPACRRYTDTDRVGVLLSRYSAFLTGSILDVCCGGAYGALKSALGPRYEGLDIPNSYKYDAPDAPRNQPEHYCNIERQPLPFPAGAYETVLCISALEHVDNIHDVYDELFRISRRRVIVMLPNNWVGFFSSLLVGRNYTHAAGYGVGPQPKRPGERHKHFFNLEEAGAFLIGRVPRGWRVVQVDCSFERGADSWFAWRTYSRAAWLTIHRAQARFGTIAGALVTISARVFHFCVRAIEWPIGIVVWGLRGRMKYHNMTCREIWVVFERED